MSLKKLTIDLDEYMGGVAIWPAYPAIFSNVTVEDDPNVIPGIHVHARYRKGGKKVIDDTFDLVNIESKSVGKNESVSLSYSSVQTFLIANLLGKEITSVKCENCKSIIENNVYQIVGENEGDCNECGHHFNIDNNYYSTRLKVLFKKFTSMDEYPALKIKTHTLNLNLDKYCGGVSLMTCCRAIIWTGEAVEEDGIHVHGYDSERIRFDSTVGKVLVNESEILPEHMKILSVQKFLGLQVETTYCDTCTMPHFDQNENAFKPTSSKYCAVCKSKSNTELVISNPIIDILSKLNNLTNSRLPAMNLLNLKAKSL